MKMKNLLQFFVLLISVFRTSCFDVIYVRVGSTVVLDVPKLPDNYYVTWYFGGIGGLELAHTSYLGSKTFGTDEVWRNKLSLSPKQLTINKIEEKHLGSFVCKVVQTNKEPTFEIFKLIKVDVNMDKEPPLIPGDHFTLRCNVETSDKPRISWMTPANDKKNGGTFTDIAKSEYNGEWTCVVNSNGKEQKFKFLVSVVVFSSASRHVYTSTNLPLNVPFFITPQTFVQQLPSKIHSIQWFFIPKPSSTAQPIFSISGEKVTGYQDRGLSYENYTKDGSFSLNRNLARKEDRGTYNCSITFKNGFPISRSVLVEVLQIIPSPGTEVISGNHLNLSCSTGSPLDADLKVIWFPPKTSSLAKGEFTSHHLITLRVGTEDSGKWRCELKRNATTLTSAEITLKIDPILTMWMLVTICAAGIILILLLVLGFILLRRRQRKIRQFRHRLCQCKHPKPKGFYKA